MSTNVPAPPQTISPASTESPGEPHPHRKHPCVLCQKRKVKCDRNYPCGNCTKARVECISPTTLPPKRRKKRFPEAELLARLRKYEEHLRRYGADIDAINAEGTTPAQAELPRDNYVLPDPVMVPYRSLAIRKALKHMKK